MTKGSINNLRLNKTNTTPFFLIRYVSTLTLVKVKRQLRGLYTVQISNDDDAKELMFDIEVKGQINVSILSLSLKTFTPLSIKKTCTGVFLIIWIRKDIRYKGIGIA